MLSNRITENRRLLTAAPAMRHRIITRSRPRVLRPVACLRNCPSSTATAMFAGNWSESKETVLLRPRHRAFERAIVHEHTFPTPRLGIWFRRHAPSLQRHHHTSSHCIIAIALTRTLLILNILYFTWSHTHTHTHT